MLFLQTLKKADRHGRFGLQPGDDLGPHHIVRSKLTMIDDTLLRVGSANINNRSLGFDTACDLTMQASTPAPR